MPFTLSHPAAAIPLRRYGLVLSALIIGSMAPDLPFYIKLPVTRGFSHSLPGAIIFSFPLAVLVFWVFHRWFKHPLVALLPHGLQARLLPAADRFMPDTRRRWLLSLLSIFVGLVTHLVWDLFTHHNHGNLVEILPLLDQTAVSTPFGDAPWYIVLQIISSILGLALILLWSIRWFLSTRPSHPNERLSQAPVRMSTILIIAVGIIPLSLGGSALVVIPHGGYSLYLFIREFIVNCLALSLLAFAVYAFNWHRRQVT